ncbi:hypothetical protein A6J66_010370 [Yersinia enterocolitica]|nr:hypothetical protein A6J66_010370 [Yersinia enterocolitica]
MFIVIQVFSHILYPSLCSSLWTPFGKRKILYYKGFPGMSTPVFSVPVCSSLKLKGRDCGTINGHEES